MRFSRDAGHLLRPAAVLLAGLVLFLVIRSAVIPKDFGRFGHYRPAALELLRQRPVAFAGQQQCAACHEEEAKVRAGGRHAHVACEACHGPQAKHAEDFVNVKPALPDVAILCARCHEKDPAKPRNFPQVATAEHSSGLACNTCHKPHDPHL